MSGPLVLDRTHKVPERINTFLREYQRDGIRFFWERYREGRGGLLGDDMGLVREYASLLWTYWLTLSFLGRVSECISTNP